MYPNWNLEELEYWKIATISHFSLPGLVYGRGRDAPSPSYSITQSMSIILSSTLKFIHTFVTGLPDKAKREA